MKGAQKWSSALSRMPEGHPLVAKRAVTMVRGEETMVSPGYCSKETFLKCLRLEVHILPCAAMVGLLRVLPAPICSQGNWNVSKVAAAPKAAQGHQGHH